MGNAKGNRPFNFIYSELSRSEFGLAHGKHRARYPYPLRTCGLDQTEDGGSTLSVESSARYRASKRQGVKASKSFVLLGDHVYLRYGNLEKSENQLSGADDGDGVFAGTP